MSDSINYPYDKESGDELLDHCISASNEDNLVDLDADEEECCDGNEISCSQNEDDDLRVDGESNVVGGVEHGDVDREGYLGEPKFRVGVIAEDEKDRYDKYNYYAFSRGFGVRKSHRVLAKGTTVCRVRKFVCSCEGFKAKRREERNNLIIKRGKKMDTRTGCNAYAHFKRLSDGKYVLYRFHDEHNHYLVPQGSRHQIKSHRGIAPPAAAMIEGLSNARLGPADTYRVVTETSGGYGCVGFTSRDCSNYIMSMRKKHFEAGDCQSMMDHFSQRKTQDPFFYSSYQLDNNNRLTNVFWRDGASVQNYSFFGDVVVFDTTFRTNRYDMVCAPFIGVNNHCRNIYYGCAFLLAEDAKSFTWLFKKFLDSMGGIAPVTIFTDADKAMAKAIKDVFPATQHRLCVWHIDGNAKQYIKKLNRMPGFMDNFRKLLYDVESPAEFEERWGQMLGTYEISPKTKSWLAKLYKKKEKWSPAYGRDIFTANIHSTQRSESANHAFKSMTTSWHPLSQFILDYESVSEKLREDERKDNYRCFTGKTKILVKGMPIMHHAAKVYTHVAFERFQTAVLTAFNDQIISIHEIPSCLVYTVQDRVNKSYLVSISPLPFISCSCQMWERTGMLCGHAVRVMDSFGWTTIPDKFVLKRWTRDLRFSESLMTPPAGSRLDARKGATVMCLSSLMRRACEVMNLCAENGNTAEMAEESLKILQNKCKQFRAKNRLGDDHEIDEGIYQRKQKQPLLDPETRVAKRRREGVPNEWNKSRGRRRKAAKGTSRGADGEQRAEETTETQPSPMHCSNMSNSSRRPTRRRLFQSDQGPGPSTSNRARPVDSDADWSYSPSGEDTSD